MTKRKKRKLPNKHQWAILRAGFAVKHPEAWEQTQQFAHRMKEDPHEEWDRVCRIIWGLPPKPWEPKDAE